MRKLLATLLVLLVSATFILTAGCATRVNYDGGTKTKTTYRLVVGPVNEVILINYTSQPWQVKGYDLHTTKLLPGGEAVVRIYGPYTSRRPEVSYRVFEIDAEGRRTGAGAAETIRLNTREDEIHTCEIRPRHFFCR